jgi:poly-gamma-glutamate synthesis protein (capsule biosynthesis protein)
MIIFFPKQLWISFTAQTMSALMWRAAKGLLIDERRRMLYLYPEKFTDCTPEYWLQHLYDKDYEEYVKGAHMDMHIVMALAEQSEDCNWQQSNLVKVKSYILQQFELPYPIHYK